MNKKARHTFRLSKTKNASTHSDHLVTASISEVINWKNHPKPLSSKRLRLLCCFQSSLFWAEWWYPDLYFFWSRLTHEGVDPAVLIGFDCKVNLFSPQNLFIYFCISFKLLSTKIILDLYVKFELGKCRCTGQWMISGMLALLLGIMRRLASIMYIFSFIFKFFYFINYILTSMILHSAYGCALLLFVITQTHTFAYMHICTQVLSKMWIMLSLFIRVLFRRFQLYN